MFPLRQYPCQRQLRRFDTLLRRQLPTFSTSAGLRVKFSPEARVAAAEIVLGQILRPPDSAGKETAP